ncbi:MAG: hypothetical protein RLZZ330_1105 [Actinomycetota bacterium]|jgi:hypothetical protein
MTPQEIEDLKKIEYYSAAVTAWFNTALEHDKSILTLAAGGIALLITLLTTLGLSTAEALVLYIFAIGCFVVALVSVLIVFRDNKIYIENILTGKEAGTDPFLAKVDGIAIWSFGLGVVLTAVIGISAAINSFTSKEKTMATESNKATQSSSINESFNGAARIQPTGDFTKSFNGAANLQPHPTAIAPAASSTAVVPTPTPKTTTPTQSSNGN